MGLSQLAFLLDGACSALWQKVGELTKVQQSWSRARVEWIVEWPLLCKRWKTIVACLLFQYVHGIFTQLVYRLHEPEAEPLKDLGFIALPEIGPRWFWVSELLFGFLFVSFALWCVSPFFFESKNFYTFVLLKRLLVHLVCCQTLRILSFMSTILPGPAHHCRSAEVSSRKAWVRHWWQHLVVDVAKQSSKSCGDLIFSSHTTFILSFVLCYTYYGKKRTNKIVAWALATVLSVLIVASRKHYTVDVVIAWYTVPLVFVALERRWTLTRNDQASDRLESPAHSSIDIVVMKPSLKPTASHGDALDRLALMSGLDASPEMSQRKGGGKAAPNGRHPPGNDEAVPRARRDDSPIYMSQHQAERLSQMPPRNDSRSHSRSISIDGFYASNKNNEGS